MNVSSNTIQNSKKIEMFHTSLPRKQLNCSIVTKYTFIQQEKLVHDIYVLLGEPNIILYLGGANHGEEKAAAATIYQSENK